MRASGKDDGLQYTLGHVTSKDGTTLGFRQLGAGPAVILLHGGFAQARTIGGMKPAASGRATARAAR